MELLDHNRDFHKDIQISDFPPSSLFQLCPNDEPCQGCHGQGKIFGKRNFFQVREKSENFVDGQGNLERTWKVREKSGNLKINGYGR